MTAPFFDPKDANKHTVAADTTKLRELWAREANERLRMGSTLVHAIDHANKAVGDAIRRRKRKGRR